MPNTQHELMQFNFSPQSQEIQIELINNEPWFLAKDVCDILGLTNPTESLRTLDEDEKLTSETLRAGQSRKMVFVNESGLYNLIFRSNKPEAKKFRKWVTSEVLPSIRKTGKYSKPAVTNLLNAETINDLLEYVDRRMHNGEWYYAAIQVRKLFGKQRTGGTDELFKELLKTEEALKIPPDERNAKWWVRRSAIPKLLNIRPNTLLNISIIKALKGGIA
ncbi:MAG: Bro-N domain-containing protein [Flavisolibacter sp.]|jgi:prophage antirepressor-like protein